MGLSIEWERNLFQVGTPMSPSRCAPSPNKIFSHFVNAAHHHEIDLGAKLAFDSLTNSLAGTSFVSTILYRQSRQTV